MAVLGQGTNPLPRESAARRVGVRGEVGVGPGLKDKAALSIAYGAGLRVGEIVMLRVSDIDSKRMLIRASVRYPNEPIHMPSPLLPGNRSSSGGIWRLLWRVWDARHRDAGRTMFSSRWLIGKSNTRRLRQGAPHSRLRCHTRQQPR
jgi:integrase